MSSLNPMTYPMDKQDGSSSAVAAVIGGQHSEHEIVPEQLHTKQATSQQLFQLSCYLLLESFCQ